MEQKSFAEVMKKFREIQFHEDFDLIVAIANGGIIPAAILNQRMNIPVELLHIHLRDEKQQPLYDEPKLLSPASFNYKGKRILLVDDRVSTGSTLQFAKALLEEAAMVKTFAVNGHADYHLYDESCFRFPWLL